MTTPIDPCQSCLAQVERDRQPTDSDDHAYRLAQAGHMLHLFRDAHGRDARSTDEVEEYLWSLERPSNRVAAVEISMAMNPPGAKRVIQ